MNRQLARLQQMAQLVLDLQSQALAKASRQRAELRARIEGLSRPVPDPVAEPELSPFLVTYEIWAARRRADLNIRLAAAEAAWLEERAKSRRCFGRNEVLKKLMARPPR